MHITQTPLVYWLGREGEPYLLALFGGYLDEAADWILAFLLSFLLGV